MKKILGGALKFGSVLALATTLAACGQENSTTNAKQMT